MSSIGSHKHKNRSSASQKAGDASEPPRPPGSARSVCGDTPPARSVTPADVDTRCLEHDATLREEIRNLFRNQVDSFREVITTLREQETNIDNRCNVDFGQQEEK